jgi:hypothetical protein
MKGSGQAGLMQAYNAQIAVDSHAQIIVAAELTQQAFDCQQLLPMVKNLCSAVEGTPTTITADAGYWDTQSLLDPSLDGIELLVPPDSRPQLPGSALSPTAPRHEVAFRMRQVLATEEGKARYALRKSTVEPVFGQIKEARGIRRFRLRGLLKTTSEWKLICATHNLLKLFRHRRTLVLGLQHLPMSILSLLRLITPFASYSFLIRPGRRTQRMTAATGKAIFSPTYWYSVTAFIPSSPQRSKNNEGSHYLSAMLIGINRPPRLDCPRRIEWPHLGRA